MELNSNRGFDLFFARLVSASTGNNDMQNSGEFIVYPNPGSGQFTFESNSNIHAIEIYDLTGRKIFSKILHSQGANEEINIKGSPSGIYFIRAFDGQKSKTKKTDTQEKLMFKMLFFLF